MDTFGKIVAVVLLVFMIFINPLQYLFESQESVKSSFVEAHAKEFVDHVCSTGEITLEQYEQLQADLSNTGNLYKIDLEHTHAVTGIAVAKERMEENKNLNIASMLYTTKDEQLYKSSTEISNITINTMSNTIRNTSSHIHTDACYNGTKHVHSGNKYSGTGCYTGGTIHPGGTTCYSLQFENGYLQTTVDMYSSCGGCGNALTFYLYYGTCKICGQTSLVYSNYWCSRPWCSRYFLGHSVETVLEYIRNGTLSLRENHVIPTYYDMNCGKSVDSYYDANGNLCNPLCGSIVTGIYANVTTQTIKAGESINTSATVSFLNGSTAQVNCSTNFNNTIVGDNRIATLTYYGYANSSNVANNVKTAYTCTVTVNVKSAKKLSSIKANLSKTTIERYDNFPITSLRITYDNGETEVVTSGWSVIGFNHSVGGYQNVTISYTKDGTTCNTVVTIFVRQLTSITANMYATTISKYSNFPISNLTLTYNDGSTGVVNSGWGMTGFVNTAKGNYTVTLSYTVLGVTCYTGVNITVVNLSKACEVCGNSYFLSDSDYDNGCPQCKTTIDYIYLSTYDLTLLYGQTMNLTVYAVYKDGHTGTVTGWTSTYDAYRIGEQIVTVRYGGYSDQLIVRIESTIRCPMCGYIYSKNSDGSDPGCPICKNKITSISATPQHSVIKSGKNLELKVYAIYVDGHTKEVTEWSSDFNTYKLGFQTVTITYKGITTRVTVEVVKDENKIICENCGNIYDSNTNPNGCPYCSTIIDSIQAYLINDGVKVQLGSELKLKIIITYKDAHRSLAYSGYTLENYDKDKMGKQIVTVNYNGFTCTIEIEVVNTISKVTCPNGHIYSLNEDGSDPGCPYCADTSSSSGILYLNIVSNAEILDTLYATGRYQIPKGDYITITVTQKKTDIKMKNVLFRNYDILSRKNKLSYGGEIS